MTRTLIIPTLLFLLLGIVCFVASTADAGPRDQIVFADIVEFHTLDPNKVSYHQDIRVAMGAWEGLLAYDPRTLAPRPATAERYEISPDGLTYTFHLRPEAKWSNGDPVTAGDFLFAWKRVLDPNTASEYAYFLFHIRNAEAYYQARVAADDMNGATAPASAPQPVRFEDVGVKAPDERTLVITLAHPCTYFLDLVAFPTFYPVHARSMEPFRQPPPAGRPDDLIYDPKWVLPPHVVTNGPFRIAEWKFKRYLALEPNPCYWDRAHVRCPHLRLVTFADANAAMLAANSGTIDILATIPPQFTAELLQMQAGGRRHDVHYEPSFGSYFFIFNVTRPPFNDARVRKALALAIDKREIVEKVLRTPERPLNVVVPSGYVPGYQSPAGLGPDIPEARRLLAAAGYPGGQGFPETEILINKEGLHESIAQAMGQMWQQGLGISVRFKAEESKAYSADRTNHAFIISRAGWTGDYMDPTTWLDLFATGNGQNDGLYSNPAYDQLLAQARDERDPARRFAILHDAENLLMTREFPCIPIHQYSGGYLFDENKIGGLEINARMLTQFKYLYRKDAKAR